MAAGDPTGIDLASGTTNGNTLATYGDWTEREITFGLPIELTSGVKYAIVVKAPAVVGSAELNWSARTDNPYANGILYRSNDSGSSWATITANADVWFKTKASGVEKEDGSFVEDISNTFYSSYGTTWLAQVFTASSTYTISSVVLKLSQYLDFGGSVETVTVSIRAVEAAGPIKAKTPAPIDTFTGMTLDYQEFSWVSGTDTPPAEEVYNIYWGTTSADLSEIVHEGTPTSIVAAYLIATIGAGLYNETYYWRVDTYWPSTDETAEGDEWWFSSIDFYPPLPAGLTLTGGDGDEGDITGTPSGLNFMTAIRKLVVVANSKIWFESV